MQTLATSSVAAWSQAGQTTPGTLPRGYMHERHLSGLADRFIRAWLDVTAPRAWTEVLKSSLDGDRHVPTPK